MFIQLAVESTKKSHSLARLDSQCVPTSVFKAHTPWYLVLAVVDVTIVQVLSPFRLYAYDQSLIRLTLYYVCF